MSAGMLTNVLLGMASASLEHANKRLEAQAKRIQQLEAELAARAGWKLVPLRPTAEMDIAGRRMLRACGCEDATAKDAELCWSAMIEAAPTPDKEGA